MAISEGEYILLGRPQPGACVKDNRTGGLAKMWFTNGFHYRWLRDDADVVAQQNLFGLPTTYPSNPLPVVTYTLLQRQVLVGDSPP